MNHSLPPPRNNISTFDLESKELKLPNTTQNSVHTYSEGLEENKIIDSLASKVSDPEGELKTEKLKSPVTVKKSVNISSEKAEKRKASDTSKSSRRAKNNEIDKQASSTELDNNDNSKKASIWKNQRRLKQHTSKSVKLFARIQHDERKIDAMDSLGASISRLEMLEKGYTEAYDLSPEQQVGVRAHFMQRDLYLKPYLAEFPDPVDALIRARGELANYDYLKKTGRIGAEFSKRDMLMKNIGTLIIVALIGLFGNYYLTSFQEESFKRTKLYEQKLQKIKYVQTLSTSVYNDLKSQLPMLSAWEKFKGGLSPKTQLKNVRKDIEKIRIQALAIGETQDLALKAKEVSLALGEYESCLNQKVGKSSAHQNNDLCTSEFRLDLVENMAIEAASIEISTD